MMKTEPWPLDVGSGVWEATLRERGSWALRQQRQSMWLLRARPEVRGAVG